MPFPYRSEPTCGTCLDVHNAHVEKDDGDADEEPSGKRDGNPDKHTDKTEYGHLELIEGNYES